jgi:RHS repeat-associated protein
VNNQISGYGYDAAGNMTSDPTDGGITLSYDQENRIQSTAGYTYTYDADGNRVKKTNGTTGTLYWYMSPGIVAESDLSGTLKSEYVFFDGERVARRDLFAPGGVFYYFSDHLKTASVITDSLGNIKSESDYYPWGGELQFINNDSNHYKFTGKERDETGLDYFGARYYSNGLGRFITPDWAAKAIPVPYAEFGDPQSLNLYSYVRNVPTKLIDPDGHQSLDAQRQAAVRDAWKQEQARVAAGKPGTVNWTATERSELLKTGKVSGYEGHHINSVNGHPELARDPNNIKFVNGRAANLAEHGGNFRNATNGELMNRSFITVQVIGALVQAWGDLRFNKHESETGLHSDALFGVRVSNAEQAAQTLAPGAQIKLWTGETFTLNKDHVWANSNGDTIYYDPKDGKNHIRRNGGT